MRHQHEHFVKKHEAIDTMALFRTDRLLFQVFYEQVKDCIETMSLTIVDHNQQMIDAAIEHKKELAHCTRECNFVLKDKNNWVKEILVHVAVYHWWKIRCTRCEGITFKVLLEDHLKSNCQHIAFF